MASVFQKSLVFLGLVDEEQLTDDEIDGGPRHVESSGRPERATVSRPQSRTAGGRQAAITAPGEVRGRRVEPPPSARRMEAMPSERNELAAVRKMSGSESLTQVVEVTDFDDAKVLADRIRDRDPVVLDLRNTTPEMVRRVIDFATGLTYALDGSMRKIGDGIILISPPRVSIGRDEKRRLAGLGLYDLDIEQ